MFRMTLVLILLLTAATANAQNASTASTVHPPVLDITSIDPSVDPCTDFFAYSCGDWLKKNPIPPDKTSWSAAAKLQDENKVLLREILEEASAGGASRDPVKQKIGDYYAACMDEKTVEAAGTKPLQGGLERISGMHSKRDIARVASEMLGQGVLFDFQSDQDFKNSSQVIAEVDQGGLGLPDRDYYLRTDAKSVELRQAYVAHERARSLQVPNRGHGHGGGLHFAVRGHQLLDRAKCAAAEFAGHGVGPRHVRVHYAHQADRFALLGQLVIDAGVVAPESAHADHRDVNKVVRQL